jgi:hypothetical protein
MPAHSGSSQLPRIQMPPFARPLTESEIVEHFNATTLLPALLHPLNTQDQEVSCERLAARHNAGDIDLLALVATPEFQALDRRAFFTVQQIYCGVLPRLNAKPLLMLDVVGRLVAQAGNDGMATIPRNAMRQWITQDPNRAESIVTAAKSDLDIDLEVLRDSLVALGDMDQVRFFLEMPDIRRRAAVAAIGGLAPLDQAACNNSLAELEAIAIADQNEEMRFTAIFSAFMLLRRFPGAAPQFVSRFIGAVVARPSEETRTALLQGLWQQSEIFQGPDVEAALTVVCEHGLSDALLNMLSGTLSHLIGGPLHNIGMARLTNLLASDGKAIPLDQFASLEHHLAALERPLLFTLALQWFLTGDHNLCGAAAKTVLSGGQETPPFNDTFSGRGLSGSQTIVICHKAVAYMPLAPAVAASFVVAALRAQDTDIEPELVQVLFQSVLINYGEAATAYLKSIPNGDAASPAIKKALKLHRNYEKGLTITTPIKELSPSSYQRGAVRQKHYLTGREIRKEAERQSIFFNLVHRSTLLYGRKSITYVGGADHPPVSMEMKTMSASFTMPTLETIDPVGFDYMRRIFLVSKPK